MCMVRTSPVPVQVGGNLVNLGGNPDRYVPLSVLVLVGGNLGLRSCLEAVPHIRTSLASGRASRPSHASGPPGLSLSIASLFPQFAGPTKSSILLATGLAGARLASPFMIHDRPSKTGSLQDLVSITELPVCQFFLTTH